MSRHVPVAEQAHLIRRALKEAFPGVKFSVTSKSYSGGCSVRVGWTDGPTEEMVNHVVHRFQGCSFDAMEDLKTYVGHTINGESVDMYGWVNTSRDYSPAFLKPLVDELWESWADLHNHPKPEIRVYTSGSGYLHADPDPWINGCWLTQFYWREIWKRSDRAYPGRSRLADSVVCTGAY